MKFIINGKEATSPPSQNGTTYTPSVSAEGELSWTNDGDLENPSPVNIRGPKGDKGDTALDVYSTEETRIGTWIDGKPLYRCVIAGTTQDYSPGYRIATIKDIEWCSCMYGTFKTTNTIFMSLNTDDSFSDIVTDPSYSILWYDPNNDGLFIRHAGGGFINVPYTVVIEYTKTTDTATKMVAEPAVSIASDETYKYSAIASTASAAFADGSILKNEEGSIV